jgi:Domain of unknown function (DUF4136)
MRNWIIVVALLAAPAPTFAQKVNVDSDRSAAFARYRTYAWTAGTPAANPLAQNRIHAAVESQLAAHGFTPAATPDVFVATIVVTHQQKELVANGFGGGFMLGGYATATVQTYEQGTLVVDLYDARTKQLVWRGKGTDMLSDKPEKNTAKMNKAIAKMFEQYPPTPK